MRKREREQRCVAMSDASQVESSRGSGGILTVFNVLLVMALFDAQRGFASSKELM